MKIIKKICVYLLVGVLCCSSVMLSYEKANNCEAAAIGLYIGAAILAVAGMCYGAYYVSQPENQEAIKQTLSDYKNNTVESAKRQYALNKKFFDDFCDYAVASGGGSAAVYTADGGRYTVDQMREHGFPDFDYWDKEMKKQSEKPKGSIWDKLQFGLDLLNFILSFFKDDPSGLLPPVDRPQLYFTGDSDYINRETGEINAYWYSDMKFHSTPDRDNPQTKVIVGENMVKYVGIPDYMSDEFRREKFRCAILLVGAVEGSNAFQYYTWTQSGSCVQDSWLYAATAYYSFDNRNGSRFLADVKQDVFAERTPGTYWGYDLKSTTYYSDDSTSLFFNSSATCEKYCSSDNSGSLTLSDFTFVSSNLPVFTTNTALGNYLDWNTNGEDAINYRGPLAASPTPTPFVPSSDSTSLDVYVDHFRNGSYTPGDVIYTNFNIANNWDGSTTNLIYILNGNEPTPINTITPLPSGSGGSGSGSGDTITNINITIENLLQVVIDIHDFFNIDVGELEVEFDFSTDSTFKLSPLLDAANTFKGAFSGLEMCYPKITMKCPAILDEFLELDGDTVVLEDGIKVIVLCDFADYAVYFVRFRLFLDIVIKIGLFFYLLREFTVAFNIS